VPPRASPETTVPSTSGGRPRSRFDLSRAQELRDPGRRDAFDERHRPDVEPELRERVEIAGAAAPEAEVRAGDDDLRAQRTQDQLGELFRRCQRQLGCEGDDERLDAQLAQQLQAALEGRQELDLVAQNDARVWVERQHSRRQVRRLRGLDHAPVAQMHTVERADCDRTVCHGRILGVPACRPVISDGRTAEASLAMPPRGHAGSAGVLAWFARTA
jgi:hypothetical protein